MRWLPQYTPGESYENAFSGNKIHTFEACSFVGFDSDFFDNPEVILPTTEYLYARGRRIIQIGEGLNIEVV